MKVLTLFSFEKYASHFQENNHNYHQQNERHTLDRQLRKNQTNL